MLSIFTDRIAQSMSYAEISSRVGDLNNQFLALDGSCQEIKLVAGTTPVPFTLIREISLKNGMHYK